LAFPLDLQDPSLWLTNLGLWLAISSSALLVASELLLDLIGSSHIRLDRRRLRTAGFAVAILFLGTIALRILDVVWKLRFGHSLFS
jgi:hypothetical protein